MGISKRHFRRDLMRVENYKDQEAIRGLVKLSILKVSSQHMKKYTEKGFESYKREGASVSKLKFSKLRQLRRNLRLII